MSDGATDLPPDPWRPTGAHPFGVALDEAAALGRLVEQIETVDGVVAAIFALSEAEVRMIVLERALRLLREQGRASA